MCGWTDELTCADVSYLVNVNFKFSLTYNLDFSNFFCLITYLIDKICGLEAFE